MRLIDTLKSLITTIAIVTTMTPVIAQDKVLKVGSMVDANLSGNWE